MVSCSMRLCGRGWLAGGHAVCSSGDIPRRGGLAFHSCGRSGCEPCIGCEGGGHRRSTGMVLAVVCYSTCCACMTTECVVLLRAEVGCLD